jgi:multidrug resistance protein MdtO
MASNMQALIEPATPGGFFHWFGQFLKGELTPYPGRWVTVARMVIAATLTMILIMTFKIPGGALGATYALLISRDSLYATLQSASTIVVSYTIGLGFLLLGAIFFADAPIGRFLWLAGSLFVIFFVLRTLQNFGAATGFAFLVVNGLPAWQSPGTAEAHLETTLWLALSVAVGTAVTVTTEIIFRAFHAKNELFEGFDNRLIALNRLLSCYAENRPIPAAVRTELIQYAVIGVSGLRRMLARSVYTRQYRDQMTAVVGLTGRLSDLGSTLAQMPYHLLPDDSRRAAELIRKVDEIRVSINAKSLPPAGDLPIGTPSGLPLLPEIERTVALIPRVFSGGEPVGAYVPAVLDEATTPTFFVRDAFSNNEHVKFALRGCLAGTLCYFLYSILDWSGLATSVTTVVITALTNIGASRQKQLLRFGGTLVGGLLFGMGAQVFILPEIDSITQFALLFAAVTAFSAWFGTASSRISYFGVQVALAFYLINLQEFTIQTSLSVARDRVVGVLLGLFAMWLIFDQIWAKPATDEMVKFFVTNVHLIGEFAASPTAGDPVAFVKRVRAIRNSIHANFQNVSAQADAVPFEFGSQRQRHMAARAYLRGWQPTLRTLYLMLAASMQLRIFGAHADFDQSLLDAQFHFNQACGRMLQVMAAHLQNQDFTASAEELSAQLQKLEEELMQEARGATGATVARAEGMLELSCQITPLLQGLFRDVMLTPAAVFAKG